jgi:hypothetical protein
MNQELNGSSPVGLGSHPSTSLGAGKVTKSQSHKLNGGSSPVASLPEFNDQEKKLLRIIYILRKEGWDTAFNQAKGGVILETEISLGEMIRVFYQYLLINPTRLASFIESLKSPELSQALKDLIVRKEELEPHFFIIFCEGSSSSPVFTDWEQGILYEIAKIIMLPYVAHPGTKLVVVDGFYGPIWFIDNGLKPDLLVLLESKQRMPPDGTTERFNKHFLTCLKKDPLAPSTWDLIINTDKVRSDIDLLRVRMKLRHGSSPIHIRSVFTLLLQWIRSPKEAKIVTAIYTIRDVPQGDVPQGDTLDR